MKARTKGSSKSRIDTKDFYRSRTFETLSSRIGRFVYESRDLLQHPLQARNGKASIQYYRKLSIATFARSHTYTRPQP